MKIYQEIIEVNQLCKEKFGKEYSGFEINEFKDQQNVVFSFLNDLDIQFYFEPVVYDCTDLACRLRSDSWEDQLF